MAYRFGARKPSQYHGVGYHKRSTKWQATIWFDGKLHHLGLFSTEGEAALAYDEKAREVWGADADLNFPHTGTKRRGARVVSANRVVDAVMAALEQDGDTGEEDKRALVTKALRDLDRCAL